MHIIIYVGTILVFGTTLSILKHKTQNKLRVAIFMNETYL